MEEKVTDSLYFPQNLRLNKEIVRGLGKRELVQAGLLTVVLNLVNILIYPFRQDVFFAASYFFITAATSYGLFAKLDDSNISFVDQVAFMLRRMKSPVRYRYYYFDEWEMAKIHENRFFKG